MDLLTADLAARKLKEAEELFQWAQERTGIPAPSTIGAWIAPDE